MYIYNITAYNDQIKEIILKKFRPKLSLKIFRKYFVLKIFDVTPDVMNFTRFLTRLCYYIIILTSFIFDLVIIQGNSRKGFGRYRLSFLCTEG